MQIPQKSQFSPLLINQLQVNYGTGAAVQSNYFDNKVYYRNTQFRQGDKLKMIQFDLHRIFSGCGTVQLDAGPQVALTELFYYTYAEFVAEFNAIDPTLQIAENLDADGNFVNFTITPGYNGTFTLTGNIQYLTGFFGQNVANLGVGVEGGLYSPYTIQYIKLRCQQLDGASIISQGGYNLYESGIVQIIFPQNFNNYFSAKTNDFLYTLVNSGDLCFELLDQKSRPVYCTQFYIQILMFFRDSGEVSATQKKKLAFILFNGEYQKNIDFSHNIKWLAIDDIYAGTPVVSVPAQFYTDLFIHVRSCSDLLAYLIGYQSYISILNKSDFLWKKLDGSSNQYFYIDEQVFDENGYVMVYQTNQYICLKVYYLTD